MARKLALFFDGTWNQQKDDTNVRRLFELTRSHRSYHSHLGAQPQQQGGTEPGAVEQIKYYHVGVGVALGERLRGGVLGYGLSRNIKDGYLWLAQHFQPGDDLYIFGFSRGAYTARSLVGLMRKCGILQTASEAL